MSRIVGIDLGTTNSLIALIEKGRPRLFKAKDGANLIPSVVHFPAGDKPIVGSEARAVKVSESKRTLYSAKRFLGRGLKDSAAAKDGFPFDFSPSTDETIRFQVGERAITPVEVSGLILAELKQLAEAQLGEKIDRAVVTVPAYFDDAQRQATKLAGQVAGLEVVRIVNEPTAACLAYGLDKKAAGLIAVFDLGGGTFDISVLRVHDGVFEVLATAGDTTLGGDDFDFAIAQALAKDIQAELGFDPLKANEHRVSLLVAAEKLKVALSTQNAVEFSLLLNEKPFSRSVTAEDLKTWIEPVLARVQAPVLQCVKDAGVPLNRLTDVILVGGSTRMPIVRERVQALFTRAPICSINPDEVVAMGAAVQANILTGQGGGMLLLDVIPLSLGIETMGGVIAKIIHRNSTIPVSASEHFSTHVDGQVAVDIHVLQGERELAKDNRSLARFQLKGLPPLPAGVPKIEVEFILDANGILSVRAMELRTGTIASVEVNPSYGIGDAEVEKMLMDSFENAEQDFEVRFLIEVKTEAESVLRSARKSLSHGAHLVNAEETAEIQNAISALEKSLSSTDRTLVKAKLEALEVSSRGLAERLLNEAVSGALKDRKLEDTPS